MPPVATNEIGTVQSWAAMGGVWDQSEQLPSLQWPSSVQVYDSMRRQDAQVRAILWALTLPLRRPIWAIDPAGARPEVAAQIAEDLDLPVLGVERGPRPRIGGRFTWSDHLRLALLSLSYGHMPFEQVYDVRDGRAHLRKLAPRFPASLVAINAADDGGLRSIEQAHPRPGTTNEPTIVIPVDRLVMYVVDREGASWQGNSVLRAAYKDWLLKDRTLRVTGQSFERNAMGVPIIEAQEGATDAQLSEYQALASAYRAGDKSGGALPHGARLRLVGVEGTLPDPLPFLDYLDTQIAKSVQAQFMQLGTGESSGNRALGGTFVDFFASAVDGIAGQIADTTTQHVVEDLVDLNWGSSEPAPRVVARSIDAEEDLPIESLTGLLRAGAIAMDDELEAFLRSRYRMPARGDSPARPVPSERGSMGAPVAASAPGAEDVEDELTSFYAPRVAQALHESTDVDAIVAALEDEQRVAAARAFEVDRVAAAAEQRREDRDMQITTLIGAVSAMAGRPHPEPVINVAAPSVTVTPPSVTVEAPHITVETPAVNVTTPAASLATTRTIKRNAAGDIVSIHEEPSNG